MVKKITNFNFLKQNFNLCKIKELYKVFGL